MKHFSIVYYRVILQDHLSIWINGFMALLKLQISQMDARSIDSEANILDKLKCCICEIITLYSQVYLPSSIHFLDLWLFTSKLFK